MGKDLRIWVTDPADPAAYPIVTFTRMLFFREHGNERIGAALPDFVTWALTDGQDMAADLSYIPMPEAVVERGRAEISNIRSPASQRGRA